MPIATGTTFQILSAVDTSRDPTVDNKDGDAAKNSGRLIEVEDDAAGVDDENGWQRRDRETARCLKLGLQGQGNQSLYVGIELERINWTGPVETLLGKSVRHPLLCMHPFFRCGYLVPSQNITGEHCCLQEEIAKCLKACQACQPHIRSSSVPPRLPTTLTLMVISFEKSLTSISQTFKWKGIR